MALAAHARYATGDDEAHGRTLFADCRDSALRVLGREGPQVDYPATGTLLFALGIWALLRGAGPAQDAVRLLALADRFSYSQQVPTMLWERTVPAAEEAAPGLLAKFQAGYADRQPADLLAEAHRLAERLPF